jgi:hypothetical protein
MGNDEKANQLRNEILEVLGEADDGQGIEILSSKGKE